MCFWRTALMIFIDKKPPSDAYLCTLATVYLPFMQITSYNNDAMRLLNDCEKLPVVHIVLFTPASNVYVIIKIW